MGRDADMRCFRFSSDAAYEQVRAALDTAFGYPSPAAETTVAPTDSAPRDTQGRIVLALKDNIYDAAVTAGVLPWQGAGVSEITEAAYRAATTASYA